MWIHFFQRRSAVKLAALFALTLAACFSTGAIPAVAQDVRGESAAEYNPCSDCMRTGIPPWRVRWNAWIFRQYAGSTEMVTRVPYPRDYYGSYYYSPWRPSWIRDTPPEGWPHFPSAPYHPSEYGPLNPPFAPDAIESERPTEQNAPTTAPTQP